MKWKPSNDQDTICAISTPPGVGGISVIRLDGPNAFTVVKKISFKLNNKIGLPETEVPGTGLLGTGLPEKPESHRAYFTRLKSVLDDKILDEVIVTYFAFGKSYTGNTCVEISCHGNPLVCAEIIKNLIHLGCRMAERGEFTYRAFMNNKIDLLQAESVLSLIHSQSKKSLEISLRQLKGELSQAISKIEEGLTLVLAHIEAGIDFSEEDIKVNDENMLKEKMKNTHQIIKEMLANYKKGRIIKEGLLVTFLGEPNVGKSSLLNAMLGESRAIVTDIAGTTRDTIEGQIQLKGQLINLIDSAGIYDSSDEIEKEGIQRSLISAQKSDVVFFVIDVLAEKTDFSILNKVFDFYPSKDCSPKDDPPKDKKILFVLNKIDQDINGEKTKKWQKILKKEGYEDHPSCHVHSLTKKGSLPLVKFLEENFSNYLTVESSSVINQSRHFELLTKADLACERVLEQLQDDYELELIALDIYEALVNVKEILGKKFDDEVMDRVFSDFCIGK